MSASEKSPSKGKAPSLQGGLGASRAVIQAILALAAKHRRTQWPAFPMGQKTKGTFKSASSYLLQQLIHRSRSPDAEVETHHQNEEESEESEESETMNLEEEFDGILREEAVAEALDELGWSGPGTEQVYLNLNLSHCDLADISILRDYIHLQKLNLSGNKIEDLSCVSYMPYLLELNASQNKLTTFFNFKPPQNLKKVDFSSNQISEMCDLSAYNTLTQLILDNNEIREINGLENCISLTHLSLAGNKITTINGLGTLPIKVLCLRNNQIETIMGLEELKALQKVDLSYNQISSLQGLENHDLLEVINLEDNKIEELSEIEYIENLPILRVLNLLKNPIQNKSEYWHFVIFMLLRLTELDQQKIKVEEKVSAVNKYDPPPEVVAVRDHMTHVVNSMSQPQRIFDSTLPSLDAPYPMLILTGPAACGKRELAHRLCRQFNTYFRYGACHTTRPPYFGEGDRVDYHFISQEVFDEMLNMGKFILTFNYGNHNYGLNRDTVEGIARDGLASCIHMEIEGVRSLKYSYFEPRYILVVPMDKEKYEGYLRRKGLFSRAEIEFTVSRVDVYVKINRKFPGYFDAVINADDLDVAYKKLSDLIREYLGLTEEATKGLAPAAGAPSSKKTISGVPAHLVPSPRRLARLQADGQKPEALPEVQTHAKIPESQNLALPQSQELTEEGEHPKKDPSSSSHLDPPQQVSSSTLDIPQQAQDTSPKMKEGDGQPVSLPPKITTEMDGPEDEPEPLELKAGQSSTLAAQELPQHPDPPPRLSPQPDQAKESGEIEEAPSNLPLSERSQVPDPASLSPPRVQDEGTESAHPARSSSPPNLPEDPSPSDVVKASGGSQPPLKEGTPKAVVRASTPYPEIPPPQDSSTNSKHSQVRGQPVALLPKSRLAPTRLPQPQTLAPLQSRRPTPKLLSPSREEALGTSSDQTPTPSPRSLPTQDGDPNKLPPISPPQSKPPPNPSPPAARSPQQSHVGKASEVKLPLISPPIQEQAQQHSPSPPQEEEAPKVRLPHIPAPSVESQLPQNTGPRPASKPAKERKTPKVGHASSKKISDLQPSPHSQEAAKQKDARKKKLRQRETAKGSPYPRKIPSVKSQTAQQSESHSKPTPRNVSDPPDSRSPLSHTEVEPADPQDQEDKTRKAHNSKKKDLAQSVGASQNREMLEGLAQETETALGENQPTQDAQPLEVHPGGREQAQKKERSQKREVIGKPSEQEVAAPSQLRAKETQARKDTSEIRQGYAQRHNILMSKQQSKEKRTRKNGDVPQNRSPTAPQNQVSEEEQGGRTGRLRARGSQSIKV
ncbi:leucine-rich repeat and guanylate kinase domain-containing protein isoform X2 [Onychomys torridus]|uniref:leucine-rich repeat and guanylate kinase domain-containing protein isoform X2 n=1 Tax=Onychomys torridus TaxID=38674 RepID=UPI00167F6BD9|nr:leucine-rich repeat and guanylate kinase domain-containing protein isoform X2 [Onychomys torridus]